MDNIPALTNKMDEREKALNEIDNFGKEIENLINDYIKEYCVSFKERGAINTLDEARNNCINGISYSLDKYYMEYVNSGYYSNDEKINLSGSDEYSNKERNDISDQAKHFNDINNNLSV